MPSVALTAASANARADTVEGPAGAALWCLSGEAGLLLGLPPEPCGDAASFADIASAALPSMSSPLAPAAVVTTHISRHDTLYVAAYLNSLQI